MESPGSEARDGALSSHMAIGYVVASGGHTCDAANALWQGMRGVMLPTGLHLLPWPCHVWYHLDCVAALFHESF